LGQAAGICGSAEADGALGVASWTENTGTVAGESLPSNGSFAIADPRPNLHREKGDAYVNGGHYGVIDWSGTANTVSQAAVSTITARGASPIRATRPRQTPQRPRASRKLRIAVSRSFAASMEPGTARSLRRIGRFGDQATWDRSTWNRYLPAAAENQDLYLPRLRRLYAEVDHLERLQDPLPASIGG
jgi:hypothetical protein